MENYQKLFIGIAAICLLAICAVPASAAIPTRVKVKAKDFVTKTSTSIGNAVWGNKGAIVVGTGAVAVASNPAPFIEGAATVITGRASNSPSGFQSYIFGWLFYLVATLLAIVGVRCTWNYVKDYKNWLPFLFVGVLLCCGDVAEAAVLSVPEIQSGVIYRPWWDIFSLLFFIIAIFVGV
jgi:hypothetical protein